MYVYVTTGNMEMEGVKMKRIIFGLIIGLLLGGLSGVGLASHDVGFEIMALNTKLDRLITMFSLSKCG